MHVYVLNDPIDLIDPYGLASCTYSISSHTIICQPNIGGASAILGPNGVWSGWGICKNDPSSNCISNKNIGAIVPGNYIINQDNRDGHQGFWRLEPNPEIAGWKCALFARCGFELHPGTTSLGCIPADKTNSDTMNKYWKINGILIKENGDNHLDVTP